MIRHAAAIALVLFLSPAWLHAQSTEFTVNAASANVHKSPSTGSPVVGRATRGAVLPVTRELGSWVRISWPAAEDGVGYVHVSMGWLAKISAPGSRPPAGPTASAPTPGLAPAATAGVQANLVSAEPPPSAAPLGSITMTPAVHGIGLGGRMGGSTLGYGFSARASMSDRVSIQLEVSRYAPATLVGQPRLTSLQFAPSVLVGLPDKVSDYVWVRPYVGGGVTVYRSTLGTGTPGAGDAVSDNRLGKQAFGGTEVIFAAAPRFTLSADYGYRWPQTPFAGYELGGRGLSVSGHWYVK
jgi:hypothetical protein